LARGYTKQCILRLGGLMLDPGKDEPTSTSVAAARILLDRGWGVPAQPHTGEDGEGGIEIIIRHILEGKK